MFDKTLRLFDDHFRNLNVAGCWLIEGRRNNFTLHRALHVGYFFRPLVDQENDQIAFRMVSRDRMRDVLQQNRLTGTRRSDDQTALAFTKRRNQINNARGQILIGRNFEFHLEALIWIERCQIVKMDLVFDFFRVIKIDRVDLEQCEITFALFRTTNWTFNRVAGLQ